MNFRRYSVLLILAVMISICCVGLIMVSDNTDNEPVSTEKKDDDNSDDDSTDIVEDIISTEITEKGTKVTKTINQSTSTYDVTTLINEKQYHLLTIGGEEYIFSNNIETYLIMGTDLSGNEDCNNQNGYGSTYRGSMADFLCLVVVDHTNKQYVRLEINRDTLTSVKIYYDGTNDYAYSQTVQLCVAHWYGTNKTFSCKNQCEAVSQLLGGMEINYYLAIPMKDIGKLNNAVGGVTLTVDGDLTNSDKSLVNGKSIRLTDEQAYHYVSSRMNVDDGENTSRMRRQKQYLNAFMSIAKTKAKNDVSFGLNLYNTLQSTCTTNLNANKTKTLTSYMNDYKDLGTTTFSGTKKIGVSLADGIEHSEFYISNESIVSTLSEFLDLKKK